MMGSVVVVVVVVVVVEVWGRKRRNQRLVMGSTVMSLEVLGFGEDLRSTRLRRVRLMVWLGRQESSTKKGKMERKSLTFHGMLRLSSFWCWCSCLEEEEEEALLLPKMLPIF